MTDNGQPRVVKLGVGGKKEFPVCTINIPSDISRALRERGYTHVYLTMDERGIIARPFVGGADTDTKAVAVLPDWGSGDAS